MAKLKTLIIDNYDSFTFNLFQMLGEIGGNPVVYRNDELDLEKIAEIAPTHILISPGPGSPDDPAYFGVCSEVIAKLSASVPTLGVCLGHQGICHVLGGRVVRAPAVMHGKSSQIVHDQRGIFARLPSPLPGMRYHSLVAEKGSIPKDLQIIATEKKSGIVMAVQHVSRPLFGIQFHPESVGTPDGQQMLQNFLKVKVSK